jgi:lysophospholipase L1-like esterase
MKKIYFIIFILTSIVFILELFLQLKKPSVYEFSKDVGWATKKNYTKNFNLVDYYKNKYEGLYKTNTFGAREVGSPNSKKKILVIGDSFTMDAHTSNSSSWFGILQRGLESEYRKNFTISAIGGGGYGTNQQYLIADKFVRESNFDPDVVILQFCVNDFMNNSHDWESQTSNYGQFLRRPYYVDNNHLFYHNFFFTKIVRSKLFSKLKLPNYLILVYSIFDEKYSATIIDKSIKDNSVLLTQELLVKLKNLFKTNHVYAFNCKEANIYPENTWSKTLNNSGYTVFKTPSKNLKMIENTEEIFFRDGGHYNELGNKVMGKAILTEIIQQNIF